MSWLVSVSYCRIILICLTATINVTAEDDIRRTNTIIHVFVFSSQGPNRKTVRRRIGLLYHEYRQKMRDVLAKVQHIALTTDVWTKRRTSFLCLTGHTFNEKYQLVSVVLGFRRLSGQHLGDTIRNYIRYELNQLGIAEKICGITSDNGSDIKKATKSVEFGHRFWCLAHCLNLIVRNGLTLWPKPKRRRYVNSSREDRVMVLTDPSINFV